MSTSNQEEDRCLNYTEKMSCLSFKASTMKYFYSFGRSSNSRSAIVNHRTSGKKRRTHLSCCWPACFLITWVNALLLEMDSCDLSRWQPSDLDVTMFIFVDFLIEKSCAGCPCFFKMFEEERSGRMFDRRVYRCVDTSKLGC